MLLEGKFPVVVEDVSPAESVGWVKVKTSSLPWILATGISSYHPFPG